LGRGEEVRRPVLLTEMEMSHAEQVSLFVLEFLDTGSLLDRLTVELGDALPPDAYPGEDRGAVVLEMLCGTVLTALDSAHRSDVERATELIGLARARVLEHLQLARALSRRLHGQNPGGCAYG
jgi:hypothetical protein